MDPAPRPSGTAQRHIIQKFPQCDIPNIATAVSAVLTRVMALVPNLFISLALSMLDVTVPMQVITVTKLPKEIGSPNSSYIAGHAVPNNESGMPRPINAM